MLLYISFLQILHEKIIVFLKGVCNCFDGGYALLYGTFFKGEYADRYQDDCKSAWYDDFWLSAFDGYFTE